MSSKIKVLSEYTINQIAAGEVIENPASVVKELVENAIDAKASKIQIEIGNGGLSFIRISDDGEGMSHDDAILCVERHATSKIFDSKDLFDIHSMGFRGEALASIASISKMTISTALEEKTGTKVEIDGGKIKSVEPCARSKGTTIEVRQLFYNVPARKKFQKPAAVCFSDILRVVVALSLSHPYVSFELFDEQESRLCTKGEERLSFVEMLKMRSTDVLGEKFLEKSFAVESKDPEISMEGFIGSPLNTRPSRSAQYLFVNKRAVICPLISAAIKDAYGTRIPQDRHPLFVMHFTIPNFLLDVNVHPQKKEIRLREEKMLRERIFKIIESSLNPIEMISPSTSQTETPFVMEEFQQFTAFSSAEEPTKRENPFSSYELMEREFANVEETRHLLPPLPLEFSEIKPFGVFSSYLFLLKSDLNGRIHLPFAEEEGLLVVDLSAAKSRIVFENLLKADVKKVPKQALLFPLSFSFSSQEIEHLRPYFLDFESIGFEIRQSGKESLMIDAIPSFLEEKDVKKVLEVLLQEDQLSLRETVETRTLFASKLEKLSSLICRFIKAEKKSFMLQEAKKIVEELLKTSAPLQCPLGQPTLICMSRKDVEQLFKRK